MKNKQELLRQLPAITVILEQDQVKALEAAYPRSLIVQSAGEVVQDIRAVILRNDSDLENLIKLPEIISQVIEKVYQKNRPRLRRVINATGVVLHTNLGRAVLAPSAVQAIQDIAGSYSNLELDVDTGERGTRYSHIEDLLCSLTGAEAGLVVNNNAAAVLLVLNTLARGREVIVSRGQLVEIGGSFRIPDVMAQSGAVLVEVGTTNKTHLQDFQNAIGADTALLLKVHTSNYKIIGFTSEVSPVELVDLGRKKGIPVYEDLGSGVLVDFSAYGITHEPMVKESISAGVDVVTCSGDKLFGGPQAGLIVGKAEIISRIKKNPLLRALRVDKFTLAAMEATLRLYFDEVRAVQEIPALKMITAPKAEILAQAESLKAKLRDGVGDCAGIDIVAGYSQVGGGALPEENLPTFLVSLIPRDISVTLLEDRIRHMEPPVLARIQKDQLLIDPRTLLPGDDEELVGHLKDALM